VFYVILADDSDIFRTGAARVLAREEDLQIVMQCKELTHLLSALASYPKALVVISSSLLKDSMDLLKSIDVNGGRSIAIVESWETPKVFEDHGAHGVLYRTASHVALLDNVRQVSRGELVIPKSMVDKQPTDPVGVRVRARLTGRELKVISLIMQGCKNREVGLRLKTSEQAIKSCLNVIFNKLGVSDRLELALFTIHHPTLAAAVASLEAAA
jgi:DNA-binding NarL/FixJ family response regulator